MFDPASASVTRSDQKQASARPRAAIGRISRDMELAVIVLNWHHESRTIDCLRSVMAWQGIKPHIIVVDNESTEQSKSALSTIVESQNLICSRLNLGYGSGNNAGIRRALAKKYQYILLLNADAKIAATDVRRLLRRLDSNSQISILAPVIREDDHGHKRVVGSRDIARHSLTRILVPLDQLNRIPGYPLHDVDYVTGTVFLTRSNVFEEIGLLDEDFFFGGEIADFCKRARIRGHRICVDLEIEAHHDSNLAQPHIRESLYRYYSLRNRFLYLGKHHPGEIRYRAYWSLAGMVAFVRAVCLGRLATARAILIALWHASIRRFGNQNAKFL